MNRNLLLAATALTFSIVSCGPSVTFKEPQPAGSENLEQFPGNIQGQFINPDEGAVLIITGKRIVQVIDYEQKMLRSGLDSTYQLLGDTLTDISSHEKIKIILRGDTIVQHIHDVDTIFSISDDHVLRKLNGSYYLNTRSKEHGWEVEKLDADKKSLSISHILLEEDVSKLEKITRSTADSNNNHFQPTRRQFKKFVRHHGFQESTRYMRK